MELIKKNLTVVIAVFIALVASILIYAIISAQTPSVPVVYANQTLRVGRELTPDVLSVKYLPASAVPNNTFRSIDLLVGSTIYNGPVVKDNIITADHVSTYGSLLAMLNTFAPEGWTAVELPAGAGVGMTGIKRGDLVEIYSDTATGIGKVSEGGAIVLSMPSENNNQFVVAVPNNYVPAVAELIIRDKAMTITLPSNKPVANETPAVSNESGNAPPNESEGLDSGV